MFQLEYITRLTISQTRAWSTFSVQIYTARDGSRPYIFWVIGVMVYTGRLGVFNPQPTGKLLCLL
jgi:hypothetical protein